MTFPRLKPNTPAPGGTGSDGGQSERIGLAMIVIMLYRSEGLWPAPKHEDRIAKIAKRNKQVRA